MKFIEDYNETTTTVHFHYMLVISWWCKVYLESVGCGIESYKLYIIHHMHRHTNTHSMWLLPDKKDFCLYQVWAIFIWTTFNYVKARTLWEYEVLKVSWPFLEHQQCRNLQQADAAASNSFPRESYFCRNSTNKLLCFLLPCTWPNTTSISEITFTWKGLQLEMKHSESNRNRKRWFN